MSTALVTCEWMAERLGDPTVCLIEVAGLGEAPLQAYSAGHIPGAHSWGWKEWLWDDAMRDFPTPEVFARRMGAAAEGVEADSGPL